MSDTTTGSRRKPGHTAGLFDIRNIIGVAARDLRPDPDPGRHLRRHRGGEDRRDQRQPVGRSRAARGRAGIHRVVPATPGGRPRRLRARGRRGPPRGSLTQQRHQLVARRPVRVRRPPAGRVHLAGALPGGVESGGAGPSCRGTAGRSRRITGSWAAAASTRSVGNRRVEVHVLPGPAAGQVAVHRACGPRPTAASPGRTRRRTTPGRRRRQPPRPAASAGPRPGGTWW